MLNTTTEEIIENFGKPIEHDPRGYIYDIGTSDHYLVLLGRLADWYQTILELEHELPIDNADTQTGASEKAAQIDHIRNIWNAVEAKYEAIVKTLQEFSPEYSLTEDCLSDKNRRTYVLKRLRDALEAARQSYKDRADKKINLLLSEASQNSHPPLEDFRTFEQERLGTSNGVWPRFEEATMCEPGDMQAGQRLVDELCKYGDLYDFLGEQIPGDLYQCPSDPVSSDAYRGRIEAEQHHQYMHRTPKESARAQRSQAPYTRHDTTFSFPPAC